MKIVERNKKLGLLKGIYDATKKNLENRTDWQAWKGNNWRLQHVGILNTGDLLAIVRWYGPNKEQHVGLSWEDILKEINFFEITKEK